MQPPKFSTVVNATGFEMLVKGKNKALRDAFMRAQRRLGRVSGLKPKQCLGFIERMPRTGDNICMRITWQPHARA